MDLFHTADLDNQHINVYMPNGLLLLHKVTLKKRGRAILNRDVASDRLSLLPKILHGIGMSRIQLCVTQFMMVARPHVVGYVITLMCTLTTKQAKKP